MARVTGQNVLTIKISLFQNVPYLLNKLNKDVVVAISRINGFNHIDFAYGRNLAVVNRKLLKVLSLYY